MHYWGTVRLYWNVFSTKNSSVKWSYALSGRPSGGQPHHVHTRKMCKKANPLAVAAALPFDHVDGPSWQKFINRPRQKELGVFKVQNNVLRSGWDLGWNNVEECVYKQCFPSDVPILEGMLSVRHLQENTQTMAIQALWHTHWDKPRLEGEISFLASVPLYIPLRNVQCISNLRSTNIKSSLL